MQRTKTEKRQAVCIVLYVILLAIPFLGAVLQQNGEVSFSFGARQLGLLGNSLKLGISVAALSLLLGFFGALFLCNSRKVQGYKKYYFVLLLPIPFYIYALSWMYLIKMLAKIWPALLAYSVKGLGACIFVEVLAYYPLALLLFLIGMEQISPALLRMASVYGTDNRTVRRVVLETVLPYGAAAGGLICTLSMTEFSVPSMFQYTTYALDIFSVYSRTGSALTAYCRCVPLLVLLVLPVLWIVRNMRQFSVTASYKDRCYLKVRGGMRVCSVVAFGISILQILIPLVVFIITAGGFRAIAASLGMIAEELQTSFWTSVWSGVLCLLISIVPAEVFCRNIGKKWSCIFLLTMVIPGTIQAMGLLKIVNLLNLLALERSVLLTSLGCALKLTPFLVIWLCAARMRVNQKELEMADILAARRRDYWNVWLHTRAPGYVVGFAMAFFMTFAEEGIPLILMAPGKETITVKIYNYLHYGASEYVSAFSVVILVFILSVEVLILLAIRWNRRARKR